MLMKDLSLAEYFLEKGLLGAFCVVLSIALYRTYRELRKAEQSALDTQKETTKEFQRLNKEHREEIKAINEWAHRELSELHEIRASESRELAQKIFGTVNNMKEAMDMVSNLAETSIRGSNDKEKADVRKVSRNRGSV
jgi:uncharacterized protein YicC (UPF0701 family)